MAQSIPEFVTEAVTSVPALPDMPAVAAPTHGLADGLLNGLTGGLTGLFSGSSLELILVAGRAVFLIAAFTVMALAFRRWRRTAERDAQRVFEQVDIALSEIRSLAEQTAAVAARMDLFEERLDASLRISPATAGAPQRGYETAVRIARTGAGIDPIINMCGLTRHEAELLVRLHGPAQQAQQSATERPQSAASAAAVDGSGSDTTASPSLPPGPAVLIAASVDLVGSAQEERRKARSRLSVVG